MKANRLFSIATLMFLLSAASQASADPARGVYLNGLAYRITTDSGYVTVQEGGPMMWDDEDFRFQAEKVVISQYPVTRDPDSAPGEGLAVFGNWIFCAYTADAGAVMHAYVATYDPGSHQWTSQRDLGPVHNTGASGAVIVVFNGQLYVLTDSGTYTSGDGVAWVSYPPVATDEDLVPLDAVTIYPPNYPPNADADPRILVAYGVRSPTGGYGALMAATWNGKFGDESDFVLESLPAPSETLTFSGRLALMTGTAQGGMWEGAKKPAVQLFAFGQTEGFPFESKLVHLEYAYDTWGGTWGLDAAEYSFHPTEDFWVYPWSSFRCDPNNPSAQGLQQSMVLNWLGSQTYPFRFSYSERYRSDFMSPENGTIGITACGQFGGTGTDTGAGTSEEQAIRRHYWSLVGVVLGSPPFAVNGLTNAWEISPISNVTYGETSGTEVQHTQSWSNDVFFSSGMEVHAGMPGVGKVSAHFDSTYKHAWESETQTTSTATRAFGIRFGTESLSGNLDMLGDFGWGIFAVPVLIVKNWELYAYDYDFTTGEGTKLDQAITTVEVNPEGLSFRQVAFELANPGGPNDSIEGLMKGIGLTDSSTGAFVGFPPSTDLDGWAALDWEPEEGDVPWLVKLGEGTLGEPGVNTLTWGIGSTSSITFTNETCESESTGETTSIQLSAGTEVELGTKLQGVKMNLELGYDSSFSSTVKNSTTFGTEVGAELLMSYCGSDVLDRSNCVKDLTVQPYFLEATDSTAPWIPDAFKDQRPWCITWQVVSHEYEESTLTGTCVTDGQSLPPLNASGRIVSGNGGGDPGEPFSHYSIEGGRLAWVDADGFETPIPMTADRFVPSQGVSFDLSGLQWSSLGVDGTWTRDGNVWTFQSSRKVRRNIVRLKLDFDQAAFDLQIARATLEGRIRAGVRNTPLKLAVNGLYTFRTVIHHDVNIRWQWRQSPDEPEKMQLTLFEGHYNSATGSGKMSLEGALPENLPTFGDMELEMNDHTLLMPLLSMDGFQEALDSGTIFRHAKDGLSVTLDFGNRRWSAALNKKAFEKLLALRWGSSRIKVNVGGIPWYNREHRILNFTATLKSRNP
ncbi:MAG: hypothetical protein ACOWYE_12335 [Desulfatiglandales bacterium]